MSQYFQIVFDVLSDFQYFGILIERFEYVNNSQRFFTIGRNGNIPGLFFLHREAQSDQFCINCIGRSGFRV